MRAMDDEWNRKLQEMDILCAGSQFDPEVIEAFFDCTDEVRAIHDERVGVQPGAQRDEHSPGAIRSLYLHRRRRRVPTVEVANE